MHSPQAHLPASPQPDGYKREVPRLSEVRREQASAWNTILALQDGVATAAAQKLEAVARERVINLQPTTATEAEMRCALAAWQHARDAFSEMSKFVADTNRALEAEEKASKQNNLDKPADSGTIAKD